MDKQTLALRLAAQQLRFQMVTAQIALEAVKALHGYKEVGTDEKLHSIQQSMLMLTMSCAALDQEIASFAAQDEAQALAARNGQNTAEGGGGTPPLLHS